MLFKISLKNIRKSLKDYTVYFFTLILGVAIFYVFNAIDSQSVMLDVRENMMDIIKLMNDMLSRSERIRIVHTWISDYICKPFSY